MISKMTEREFREELAKRLLASSMELDIPVIIALIREAGLEFAPELVLPARLECGSSSAHAVDLWPAEGGTWTPEEKRATYAAARDRYNAYLGLREAASELRLIVGTLRPCGPLLAAAETLFAELEKGPKP